MGMGGSTIRRLQQTHRSSIKVSGQRIYHPDAASEQGRVLHCSALDHAALWCTAIAVIQALFSSLEGSKEMFNLYFVIPTVSARLLTMGEGQVPAQLSSAHRTVFQLRDPHWRSPSERLLAAMGSMSVLPAVISSLLAVFPHPFQYMAMPQLDSGTGLSKESQHQQNVLDLPLNVAVQRYKRKSDQERADNRATKRVKHKAWRQHLRGQNAM